MCIFLLKFVWVSMYHGSLKKKEHHNIDYQMLGDSQTCIKALREFIKMLWSVNNSTARKSGASFNTIATSRAVLYDVDEKCSCRDLC